MDAFLGTIKMVHEPLTSTFISNNLSITLNGIHPCMSQTFISRKIKFMTDPNEIKINCKKVEKEKNVGVARTVSPVSYDLERQRKAICRFCNRREGQTA